MFSVSESYVSHKDPDAAIKVEKDLDPNAEFFLFKMDKKNHYFLVTTTKYFQASIKAFHSPGRRLSMQFENCNFLTVLLFEGQIYFPGSGSVFPKRIRTAKSIRIRMDQDPKYWKC